MPRGSAPGERRGGREKGTPNHRTAALMAARATGVDPLDYLLSVMRDEAAPVNLRLDAAKAAAPYVHTRLSSVEVGASGPPIILQISEVDARL